MPSKVVRKAKQQQTQSSSIALIITCIYEYTRFHNFKSGPSIDKLQELLLVVYGCDIDKNEIGATVVMLHSQSNRLVTFKNAGLFLTNNGRQMFNNMKDSIIPPQTVAQPERKRAKP